MSKKLMVSVQESPEDTEKLSVESEVVPQSRECTRCDGHQYLVDERQGFGKYTCDKCKMITGFDLCANPVEFLIFRGNPQSWTKNVFGSRLGPSEQRF